MKKLITGLLVMMMMVTFLAACGNKSNEMLAIGILQVADHSSLDEAREGFIEQLAEDGYIEGENVKITIQNAQGDQSNLKSMSEKLVKDSDLLFAIGTPAAQALANETSTTPIIFTAVTDAVSAGLVESDLLPGGNITGTSDMAPVNEQIDLLYSIRPTANKVGILYNSSEINSELQADIAEEKLKEYGYQVVRQTVTTTNDVQSATESLVRQVEAIYIPTDNTLASSMTTVRGITIPTKTVVINGSVGDATAGGLATYGIDYRMLGKQAAQQAVLVLRDEQIIGEIPVETATDLQLYINGDTAEELGIDPETIETPQN